jgi:hypothetical protein
LVAGAEGRRRRTVEHRRRFGHWCYRAQIRAGFGLGGIGGLRGAHLGLVTWLIAPLVVDFFASRWLVVDYSTSRRLVIDNSAARRLIVDYLASAARPGASVRR